jgi:hypothetical protein
VSPAVISAIVYVALVLWVAGLSLAVVTLNERTQRAEEAVDTADRALAAVQAVINHLAETEPATTGRHALAPAVAMTKEQLL